MGLNSDRDYNEIYFTSLYVAHTLQKTTPKVCGHSEMLQFYSSKPYYTFHSILNNNLTTEFSSDGKKGKEVYTEAALNATDKLNIVTAVNSIVLRSMTDQNNPYLLQYKGMKELKEYLRSIVEFKNNDDITTYKNTLLELSGGRIHLELRISNLDRYLKDVFEEGRVRCIELPNLSKCRLTFTEALTLSLKEDKTSLGKSYKKYLDEWEDLGFISPEILAEGIVNQQINTESIKEKDLHGALYSYINMLYELIIIKNFSAEKLLDSLMRIKNSIPDIRELNREELKHFANYLFEKETEEYNNIQDELAARGSTGVVSFEPDSKTKQAKNADKILAEKRILAGVQFYEMN